MIHIAICDDSYSDTEMIEASLLRLQPLFDDKLNTSIFYSGERFCEAIKNHCPFDIVLMDIEMKGMDGIAAGQQLRINDENDMVLLLYISSHDNYYRQLLDVQPYAFIDKPLTQSVFADKLEKAIKKVIRRRKEGKRKVFPVLQNGQEILVPYKSILYLESRIRKIILYTTNETIEYYGRLNDEEEKLDMSHFVRAHQSYIVNLRFIKTVTGESLILTDNTEITVSSSRRLSVKNSYMEYRRNYFE